MSKRARYDECCNYMKHLNLEQSHDDIIIEDQLKEQATINELQSNITKIEQSVSARFDYLDNQMNEVNNQMNEVNNKLDKMVNLIANMADNQLYNKTAYSIE